MAIYRTVSISFWTDAKVVDDFTPDDRYFYLYLFTNPHTNLSGCYEISKKQMITELGYGDEKINKLLQKFKTVLKIVDYDNSSKEILLLNWHKYNWTSSDKFRKPLKKEIESIKNDGFREYLENIYNGQEIVYGIDTKCIDTNCSDTSVTVTVTDTVTDTVSDTDTFTEKKKKEKKEAYGERGLVKLTDDEYQKLVRDYGHEDTQRAIEYLDDYIADKGYKSKSNYSAMRRWVFDAIKERRGNQKSHAENIDDFFMRRIGNDQG